MDPNEEEEIINPNPEGPAEPPAEPDPEPGNEPEPAAEPEPEPEPSQPEGEPEPPAPAPTGSPRLDKRIERFSAKLRAEYARGQQNRQPEPYQPANLEDMEYDPETLETLKADRQRYGEAERARGIAEAREIQRQEVFLDKFELDAERVTSKYAQMDEDSDTFDPDLTASINEMYLATVGYDERKGIFHNPTVRYKDYVEAFMAVLDRTATTRTDESTRRITRQVARGGVKPSGAGRKVGLGELKPGDISKMSEEEYEKNKPEIEAMIARDLASM
jgi:hypothetical protein